MNPNLSRKDFLKFFGSGLFLTAVGRYNPLQSATLSTYGRTLINIILDGGPDFRHLFVPPPSSDKQSYGYKYWNNRTTAIGRDASSDNPSSWQTIYEKYYEPMTLKDNYGTSTTFGVLKDNNGGSEEANTWLRSQIKAGKVAIVNNVYHSITRDHPQSLLVLQSGNYSTGSGQSGGTGWGGRLAEQVSGKVISLTYQVRPFCNITDKSKLLTFRNSRNFGLKQPSFKNNKLSTLDSGIRALNSYYQGIHSAGKLSGKVYDKFVQQQLKLQTLTNQINARLTLPDGVSSSDLEQIYPGLGSSFYKTDSRSGQSGFKSSRFRSQILDLYDAFQVADLLQMRVASLNYNNWDSHKNQRVDIEPQFNDLFGNERGLYALFNNQDSVFNNSVVVISGDFGRQLKSNGDVGTDHGRGNTVLIIGGSVKGGIYGEMFPARESTEDATGKALFDRYNKDILGQTAFHKVFGKVCDWVGATTVTGTNLGTTGNAVFNTTTNPLPTMKNDSGIVISSSGWEKNTAYDFL